MMVILELIIKYEKTCTLCVSHQLTHRYMEIKQKEKKLINIEEIKKHQGSEEQRAYYLLLSFVFCCIQPRDYTVYNRRKDCIGNDISKLLMELHYIAILQGILYCLSYQIEQYPKVPELWEHRQYIIRTLILQQACFDFLLIFHFRYSKSSQYRNRSLL